jgi:peptidoglycan-N-acetylglucosamine deacetylase
MARFALTFDDGPGPSTSALLDVLHDAGVRATFFLLGRNVEEAPWCGDPARARALAVRAVREGHLLGNHTWSHHRPDRWRELAGDLRRGEAVVRAVRSEAGSREGTVPFRLPYGIRLVEGSTSGPVGTLNSAQLDPRLPVIASLGLAHQHWTGDFDDWTLGPADAGPLAQRMAAHVEACADAGLDAVLDLHDSGTGSSFGYDRIATVLAVRELLAEARARGWTTFTVPADAGRP